MTYPPEQLRKHYYLLNLIRRFEETLDALFGSGLIGGTSHLCIGQEACAVGAIAALQADDMVTSNHRGHGHFLAKGGDPGRIMAELFGKATGYSGGRGGSQHMAAFALGFLGSNGITGGMIPIATGAALTQRITGSGRVVLCFFGDGASGQGAFHEALNMGTTWRLPIVYFCENNHYAMSTPLRESFLQPSVAARVAGYGLPTMQADGNDYFSVRRVTQEAVSAARDGHGPVLVEAMTYRMCGHSKSDKCEYRTDEEERQWAGRDPLEAMARRLLADGIAPEAELQALAQQAVADIEAAVEYARQSPDPDPETVQDNLFATF